MKNFCIVLSYWAIDAAAATIEYTFFFFFSELKHVFQTVFRNSATECLF